jgi:hypothetical protein
MFFFGGGGISAEFSRSLEPFAPFASRELSTVTRLSDNQSFLESTTADL